MTIKQMSDTLLTGFWYGIGFTVSATMILCCLKAVGIHPF